MKIPLLTGFAVVCLCLPAAAWDDLGHMVVGAVAYDQLTPDVQQKVATLLSLNPQYAGWVMNVPEPERPRVAFLRASCWADDIKRDPTYKQDGPHGGNRPSGRKSARNIGYRDKLMHKYWHFIDVPFSPDNTRLIGPPVPNAETQIALFRQTLKSSTSSNFLKSYDLVWLLHLVADVHQPLHAVSRFDKAHPEGDDGGNGVMVCKPPCYIQEKLHAFWDHVLGASADMATAIQIAKELLPADPQRAAINDEHIWIQESFEAARLHVYGPIAVGAARYEVTDDYIAAAKELAMQRLALAGARLANLLNEALK